MSKGRLSLFAWGVMPGVLLASVAIVVVASPLLKALRTAPPVEEIAFERVVLSPGEIRLRVVNGGPDPVTVAQVLVDEAFWDFSIEPGATLSRLGRATIVIPYPWVQEEPHEVTVLTSTGLTFGHEIPVAVVTPRAGVTFWRVFTLIGVYVGVIPVAIGLLWLPFLRRLPRQWIHFSLALTAGLLIFLAGDALEEALEAAAQVAGAYQGSLLVLLGVVGTLLLIQTVSRRRGGESGAPSPRNVAFLVALGIGLHNLGEGLAIGAAYALGEATLGAFLVIGFMLHNSTEGLAIVAPIAQDRPKIGTLAGLGLLAGAPTILGAWIGGLAYSPVWATLFLSVGLGAIVQVVVALYRLVATPAERWVWTPLTASGLVTGMLLMYGTGLFVAL